MSASGIGEEGRERGVDVHDPGTAAVERRVRHGQDEVVLRIDRDPAAVDVGDARQAERRDDRRGAASRVVEEAESDRHVDRRGGTRGHVGQRGEDRPLRVDGNPLGRGREPIAGRRGDQDRGNPTR